MKIQIMHCSKISRVELVPLAQEYKKRLSPYCKIEDVELLVDVRGKDKRSLLAAQEPIFTPKPSDYLIVLDERGKTFSSQEFAKKIQKIIDEPQFKNLIFLIGPPYGFNLASKGVANEQWSVSNLTLPSDFAWLVVWEQVYRAFTILKGLPYHHD